MKIEGKFILKVAGTLTVISLVVAALLGLTNGITAERIDAINAEKTQAALAEVSTASFEKIELSEAAVSAAAAYSGTISEIYRGTINGEFAGYAFKVTAGGSQGDIQMIVGVDADLAVTGVSVVKASETSGIGTKVIENKATSSGRGALDQFIGMSGAGSLEVKKNVDVVTGATVSTRGVTKGVNAALAAAEALAG